MARMQPHIVSIGASQHADLREAMAWLQAHRAQHFATCEEALQTLTSDGALPQWLVLLAAHRGAFEPASIETLHRRAPLARLVVVCGSWCEGELRSGRALSGVTRVYGHQFVERAEAALAEQGSDYAGWRLPRTATAIDVSLQLRRQQLPPQSGPTIGILASRSEAAAISEAFAALGVSSVWLRDEHDVPDDVKALLWSGPSLAARPEVVMRVPTVALLNFPRQSERELARELGFVSVLGKPFLLGDLRGQLARLGCLPAAEIVRHAG
jgi:hypothetical protein